MGNIYDVSEIRERLYPVFTAEAVYRAVLFGSYAQGNATESSDIDIVIDSRGELHGLRFYGVLDSMVNALNKQIDLIEMSEIQPHAPILDEIMRQGVVIYERS